MLLRRNLLRASFALVAVAASITVASGAASAAPAYDAVACSTWGSANNTRQISFPVKPGTEATFYVQTCIYSYSGNNFMASIEISILDGDNDFPTSGTSTPSKWAFNHFEIVPELQVDNTTVASQWGPSCGSDSRDAINSGGSAAYGAASPYICYTNLGAYQTVSGTHAVTADGYIKYDLNDDGKDMLPTWHLDGSPHLES